MQALTAHVRDGRIVVDEPTTLPEGTEVRLTLPDEGEYFDDGEREALHTALARGSVDIAAGHTVEAAEFIDNLDARR